MPASVVAAAYTLRILWASREDYFLFPPLHTSVASTYCAMYTKSLITKQRQHQSGFYTGLVLVAPLYSRNGDAALGRAFNRTCAKAHRTTGPEVSIPQERVIG
eukprot:3741251-Pyramimonas_sp.AAC.1